jgi:hypothetical protein
MGRLKIWWGFAPYNAYIKALPYLKVQEQGYRDFQSTFRKCLIYQV